MSSATTASRMLDERYGRRRSPVRRRLLWILVALLAGAAIVGLSWVTIANSIDAVDVDGTAFEVNDEHSVTISFQITAPADKTILCALEAQDVEHGIVGWRITEYPPTGEFARAFTETIPTVAEATTGLVNSCWVP